MSSSFGKNIRVSIFGQSHSPAIGVCIDGLPPGFKIDLDRLEAFMARRAPGRSAYSTARREADVPEILSGLAGSVTCGAPLAAIIRNGDARPGDYEALRAVPRPSHADFVSEAKYRGAQDVSGGGHFSGRLTAPLCIAGGICLQILGSEGIEIAAHIAAIGGTGDIPFDPVSVSADDFKKLAGSDFPVLDPSAGEAMKAAIRAAKAAGDSLGGIVECAAVGLPAGIGEPMFGGMESRVSEVVFGIPAVKGVEFGNGFACAALRGSENNDAFVTDGSSVRTRTNNHGGILGGITSGMPLVFRAAFKPTPSIAAEQDSVDLGRMANVKLAVPGRHDPCIVPRAVPCVEAAAAAAILDAYIDTKKMISGGHHGS